MNPYQPPRQPLAYSPYEATPEDYANALDQLGRQRQIRTPGALATNLLAEALDRYGQHRAQAASVQQKAGSPAYTFDPSTGTLRPVIADNSSVDTSVLDPGQ